MTFVRRFDHVGITVADLDAVTAFFVGLGLEADPKVAVEGEFLDTVIGMTGARTEIVMLRAPGGGTTLELSSFTRPDHLQGSPAALLPTSWACATSPSRCTTSTPRSSTPPPRDTAWWEASANTKACGGWPTSAGPKESSSRWPSASRSRETS